MNPAVKRLRATDGRVPGRRGQATRRKLLDTTAALLQTTSYRTIKVIDIARDAGTSPATFYQYFADVEQAVLVLAEEVARDAVQLTEFVRGDWSPDASDATARAVVEKFMDFWEGHRAVLRVVELATEEGDLRFQRLRVRALSGLTPPRQGTVTFDGRDVTGAAPEALARLGIAHAPGGRGVYPGLTVGENLRLAMWTFRTDRERCEKATERVFELFPILRQRSAVMRFP